MNRHTFCEICFDNNPSKVCYSGQLLNGHVVLKLFKEKTVREIFVNIIGLASCHWRYGAYNKDSHTAEKLHLHEKILIVGGKTGKIVIPPGEYVYPFSCMLPKDLPTSVEGGKGHIRYTIAVYINRAMHPDQIFEEYFTVIKPLNISQERTLLYPHIKEKVKAFSICFLYCLVTNPMHVTAQTPATGYTPGQTIELSLKFDNESNQTFRNFQIQLVKHIKYYAGTCSISDDIVLVEKLCDGCPKRQSNGYKVFITVPDVPPTDESSSDIIKITYRLRILGSSGVFCEDLDVHFPIIIGTHPLLTDQNTTITQQPTLLESRPTNGDVTVSVVSTGSCGKCDF